MKPFQAQVTAPADLTAFVKDKRAHIRLDVDRRFRAALLEAARLHGGRHARFHIGNALEHGPSRGGVAESVRYFGKELQVKLLLTAMIVDGLEITVPGFKRWLELTGFGNDKTMIKGFVAWAEYVNGQGKVIGEARQVFEQAHG